MVTSLGIPFKKRDDLPKTYSIPQIRKKTKIIKPTASMTPFEPEPTLELQNYEEILNIINSMSLTMERSPSTFSKLHEEEIRNNFLINLNAHFEGEATGETFNNKGKTDILIRHKNKNIFIAECKIWRGERAFYNSIEQLLGYVTWRDTKTAILLFNKKQNLTQILEKVESIVKSHPCYKRTLKLQGGRLHAETIFSYIFHQPKDTNREIYLTILVFDLSKAE